MKSVLMLDKRTFKKAYGNLKDSIIHSTTYNGFGEETVTALESINISIEENYHQKAKKIQKKFEIKLLQLKNDFPDLILDYSGSGALYGIFINDETLNVVARTMIKNLKIGILNDNRFINKLIIGSIIEEMYSSENYLLFFGSNFKIPLILSTPINIELEEVDLFFEALTRTLNKGLNKLFIKLLKKKFF